MRDEDFERHALAILQRALGLDRLARFLRLYRSGSGEYTRDRHRWLEGATIQEIMADVERPGQARCLGRDRGEEKPLHRSGPRT
jgi:hypothetical protein